MNNKELSQKLVSLLVEKGMEIAQAESCTGGLLSKYITDCPGASQVFQCGVVSYSGLIKNRILGVKEETLRAHGEVSAETALEMAVGIRNLAHSDIGVGITGIAGPGGGSPEKPVGLVYFAVSYKEECEATRLELFSLKNREEVREATVQAVLTYILQLIDHKKKTEFI